MALQSKLTALKEISRAFILHPTQSVRLLRQIPRMIGGAQYFNAANAWQSNHLSSDPPSVQHATSLAASLHAFCKPPPTGKSMQKWNHYFPIYDRFFTKFVGLDVRVLEIGIGGGGSLDMWRRFLGQRCQIYGIDISEGCKSCENEYTKVYVGDQADRRFWQSVKREIPPVDILIDDGGHETMQQIVTLEEMFPHIRSGGVYLCEDIHGIHNGFTAYLLGLMNDLNAYNGDAEIGVYPNQSQTWIHGIHFYPYATVIEKHHQPVRRLVTTKYPSAIATPAISHEE